MFTVEVARDMVIDKIDIGQTVYVTNDKKFKKAKVLELYPNFVLVEIQPVSEGTAVNPTGTYRTCFNYVDCAIGALKTENEVPKSRKMTRNDVAFED